MTLRLPTLLTAAVLTAAPLAVTALPADAATCTIPEAQTRVSTKTVVLDATGTSGFDVTVAVRANGCIIGPVEAVVTSASKASTELALTAVATEGGVTTYAGRVDLAAAALDNDDAGTWRVKTTTPWAPAPAEEDTTDPGGTVTSFSDDDNDDDENEDEDESETEDEGISGSAKVAVLAASNLTADAASAQLKKGRIAKGKSLTVRGVLTRANWDTGSYTGYAKQKVDVQFRTTKGSYKKVRTIPTRSGGTFAEAVKATKDGCYRVVFTGSKTTAAAPSTAECIDVR